jgi:ATP-dependent 26S proteasome regulatory subunit
MLHLQTHSSNQIKSNLSIHLSINASPHPIYLSISLNESLLSVHVHSHLVVVATTTSNAAKQELENTISSRTQNLRRLEAQRNQLNAKVRLLRDELRLLHEPGSYVGEVVKLMGKNKVLVKANPDGKYVVDINPSIDIAGLTPTVRVALRYDNYQLHKVCSFEFIYACENTHLP